jgi:DNA-binding CsgD family transcriptional regulator
MPRGRGPRRRLPEAECTDQLLALLGGFVDWMHGPLWLTTARPANEYVVVITCDGAVIEIPGRDPGDLLSHGTELVRAISSERPAASGVSRRWWIGTSRRRLRLDLHGGPEGTLVMAQERPLPHELSAREFEVISIVAMGLTNAQIARHLFISESTVAKHVQSGMRKTGAASRAVLAANAVVEGLLLRPATGISARRLSTISA